ncbi:hypothetical protein [Spirosoma foliorum]|uniref:Uncharacterized protein n=1 Tax=Spirosoma foliorum TaxID=2710596 RepID=A0A7G5GZN8_9BACT|nr:hypothetical protein [Spirosoma foliorum]QMW04330.1 hypothetical protein H3H32_05115 [Spirosoma foliorum]
MNKLLYPLFYLFFCGISLISFEGCTTYTPKWKGDILSNYKRYPILNIPNAHYEKRFRIAPALIINYGIFPIAGYAVAKSTKFTEPGYGLAIGFGVGSLLSVPFVMKQSKTYVPFDNVEKWTSKNAKFYGNYGLNGKGIFFALKKDYRYAGESGDKETDLWFVHNNAWKDYEFSSSMEVQLFYNAFPDRDPTQYIRDIQGKFSPYISALYPVDVIEKLEKVYPLNLHTKQLRTDYEKKRLDEATSRASAAFLVSSWLLSGNTPEYTKSAASYIVDHCFTTEKADNFNEEIYQSSVIYKCKNRSTNTSTQLPSFTLTLTKKQGKKPEEYNLYNPKQKKNFNSDEFLELIKLRAKICGCDYKKELGESLNKNYIEVGQQIRQLEDPNVSLFQKILGANRINDLKRKQTALYSVMNDLN